MIKEKVWDYPRPPSLEFADKHIRVIADGGLLAETKRPILIKETSHPPVYFIPPGDVYVEWLRKTSRTSFCEWKGTATYYDVVVGTRVLEAVAFVYEEPAERYRELAGWYSFYAGPMDSVTVDGETVTPQAGGFYSGWITGDLEGPFKGAPGSWGW